MSSWFQRPKHDWLSSTRTRSDSVTVVVVKRVWAPDASRSSIGQVLTQQPDIFRLGNGVRRRGRKNRLVRRKKIGKTRHCVYLYTHTHKSIWHVASDGQKRKRKSKECHMQTCALVITVQHCFLLLVVRERSVREKNARHAIVTLAYIQYRRHTQIELWGHSNFAAFIPAATIVISYRSLPCHIIHILL